jgi:hypothetical protein
MAPRPPHSAPFRALGTFALILVSALPGGAAQPKEPGTDLERKAFFKPELSISTSHAPLADVLPRLANRGAWETFLADRGDDARRPALKAWLDPRSGAATNVLASFPLIPRRGADEPAVADAVRRFVQRHRFVLGIDVRQLGGVRATKVNDDLWQISIPQVYEGIPVRDARLAATINHGNVVVVGTEVWGDVRGVNPRPTLRAADALQAGFTYAEGRTPADVILREPALEFVPFAPADRQDGEAFAGPMGSGYGHRLVWTFVFQRAPEQAQWEVMLDAHSGEVIAFQDLNRYENQQVKGGVYPLSSTGLCTVPSQCGAMQSGWPMPFADTGLPAPNNFTNSAGVFDFTGDPATTTLTGRYVDIVDTCGTIGETSSIGTLDLGGSNNQHDCVSAGVSGGDTASARSAFYEVNKLIEQARGWLPANAWLQSRLTTNVNINDVCNAFFSTLNGSINFYRSGAGCRNTGELAGVFDHEWGHGLDQNDANGVLSNSSEAYADIAAIYRLQTSCVGYGFYALVDQGCGPTSDGTGFNANEDQNGGQHCDLDCSGVRDADYLKHDPSTPDTALGFVCTSCLAGTGPCGRQVHCAAAPVRQAAWDFAARDLQSAPYNYDAQTAFLVANRIFYQGSGNVGSWHACTCGVSASGCGAANGYMQWLAADDDDGNLGNGTPHMTALYNAFNRHGIACAAPTPQDSGCGDALAAPAVTATPGDSSVALSWTPVTGAARYWVFRTEGHAGCEFGKALIAEVAGTTYTDPSVAGGRTYYYNVAAAGTSSACFSPAGTCTEATPTATTSAGFGVSCAPSGLGVQQGGAATSTCTVQSANGFADAVDLSCTGLPAGVSCAFNPATVTPPANGTTASTLTVAASPAAAAGSFPFKVQGTSGALTRSANLSIVVNPSGGAQAAVFDPMLQAPRCSDVGTGCDSGTLLNGRAGLGPEPNQPNTINDSCADGGLGTYHADESNDRIKVSTLDGTAFTNGKTVRVEATVWSWALVTGDRLDLYYAANAASPAWTYFATLTPTVGGAQTLSTTYVLPAGTLQAVRARFRYQGTQVACQPGGYDDHDDLVFAVAVSSDTTPPTTSITSPVGGATVSGTVVIAASASDDVGVAKVEFYVDGALKSTDTTAPYQYAWSTGAVPNGSHALQSRAYDAVNNVGTSDTVTVTVNNPVVASAAYDPVLKAPKCSGPASGCDSGSLVNGRDGKGPEPNQPNTINNSCADSTGGTYHVDESLDRIRVVTTDGAALAAGKTVRIEATVWAFSPPTGERLDLYYTANAASPSWTFLTTLIPPGGGARTLSATYTLPSGNLQAVRAQFRFVGTASTCTVGAYNDRDDLVFAVP